MNFGLRLLQEQGEEEVDLGWRIGQIFVVLVVGGIGMLVNLLLFKIKVTKPLATVMQLFKGIGAGSILAVAMVHMLGESGESLEMLAEKTGDYEAWNMVFCMIAIYIYSMIDFVLKRSTDKNCTEFNLQVLVMNDDEHCAHIVADCKPHDKDSELGTSHSHEIVKNTSEKKMSGITRTISEISILSHSILVGVIVGYEATTPMLVATCFHQLLEGFAYANLVVGVKNSCAKWTLVAAYSLTTLIGQIIGVCLSQDEDFSNSEGGEITVGALTAFCSGLLMYTAIVHMLSTWVTSNKQLLAAPAYYGVVTYIGVAIGIGVMALIGKWA